MYKVNSKHITTKSVIISYCEVQENEVKWAVGNEDVIEIYYYGVSVCKKTIAGFRFSYRNR
jgi:hypothetical protein